MSDAFRSVFHPAPVTPQAICETAHEQVREVRAVLAARAAQGRWSPERDARLALECVERLATAVERIALLAALHTAELRNLETPACEDVVRFADYRRAVAMRGGETVYEFMRERIDAEDALVFAGWERAP